MNFEKEIESLTMTPKMWSFLDKSLPTEEYRKIVNDYQHREWLKLPTCKSLFGVCRYYCEGRCNKKQYCKCQVVRRHDTD